MNWDEKTAKRAKAAGTMFESLVRTIAQLRHPTEGCPWDLKQNHLSLRRYMLEEAYEAVAAMGDDDPSALCDELGDVLLQVVLNSQLADDAGQFSVEDVISGLKDKMIRRHPHVFDKAHTDSKDLSNLRRQWEAVKASERKGKAEGGVFSGLEKVAPALTQSYKIGKRAEEIDFDWDETGEVVAQLEAEVRELKEELNASKQDRRALEEELGDVFFSLAQVCRHLGIEPEGVAAAGNRKFLRRFAALESIAHHEGIDLTSCPRTVKEELWVKAKKQEK